MDEGKGAGGARAKPLLVWDGDCGFCRFWVNRWRLLTGDRVTYAPAGAVRESLPGVAPERFEESIVLVETDGSLHFGADAALRGLSRSAGLGWLPAAYRRVPGLAGASEAAYRLVARNRSALSRVTRLLHGNLEVTPSWTVGPWVFLRVLALVYLVAFGSLWVQVEGLVGSRGILPAAEALEAADDALGAAARWRLPTLLWIDSSDGALHATCAAGVALSLLLLVGVAPAPCLVLLWLLYLSLVTAGQDFLAFQWDSLLLETGLVAIFLAPLTFLPRGSTGTAAIPRLLLWWLNFRLLTLSGAVKLLSGDEGWHRLSALEAHHETQPLPHAAAWAWHHLPDLVHRLEARATLAIELLVPFLFWAPRRLRHAAALVLIGLQAAIAASGNYGFFNLLAAALCLVLFDDQAWPRRLRRLLTFGGGGRRFPRRDRRWHARVLGPMAAIVLVLTTTAFVDRLRPAAVPAPLAWVQEAVAPLRSFNAYGLFAVVTSERLELVVEGSADGVEWRTYEFRWKPGDPHRAPAWAAAYMPRLDWQAWFAAQSSPRSPRAFWFHRFAEALLECRPEVVALLDGNPFPEEPPSRVRVTLWAYRFSDWESLRDDGAWWTRQRLGTWAAYRP